MIVSWEGVGGGYGMINIKMCIIGSKGKRQVERRNALLLF